MFLIINIVVALFTTILIINMANNHKVIHEYKYLNLKKERIIEDIKFNKLCLAQNLTPNYVQIHTKCKSQAAIRTINTAKKIWLNEEVKFLYSKLHNIESQMTTKFEEMKTIYHSETIEEVLEYIRNWIEPIINKKKTIQRKKLTKLRGDQTNYLLKIESTIKDEFTSKLKNLTDINFTENEENFLGNSIKYNLNLDHQKHNIKEDLLNLEISIRQQEDDRQEHFRHNLIHEVNKLKLENKRPNTKRKTKEDLSLIDSIAEKLKENDAILTKADKGNSIVIIKKNDYQHKVSTFLEKGKFKLLTKDPTETFTKTTNSTISKCKSVTQKDKISLKMPNPKSPTLRAQPKTHKQDIPIRPIVNFRQAPTYNLCKYLHSKIKHNINLNNTVNVSNTYELIDKIKDINIPQNSLFLSFDVNDMYTNIPIDETIEILEQQLIDHGTLTRPQINDVIKLTKVTINQNYFQYNNSFYIQEDGLPMGSPLSGLLADIYMNNLETTKILNETNPYKSKLLYWYRYVDDILCLFEGTQIEAEELHKHINSLSSQIKFSKEIQNSQINFLDITILKERHMHKFKIYRKPTTTDIIIPSNSNHPWQHKLSTFHSMTHRLVNIPMSNQDFEKEKNIILYLALKNGYKSSIIEKMIRKKIKKKFETQRSIEENNRKEYICIPHNTTINKATRKTFQNSNLKITYRTKNNAFQMIKNKISNEAYNNQVKDINKSGIYQIKCSDCNKSYIGQTSRSFKKRFQEHIQALKSGNKTTMKSNFAEHLIETRHEYKNIDENLEILEYERNKTKLNVKEDFHIYTNYKRCPQNLLNTMNINKTNPIFEKILQLQ